MRGYNKGNHRTPQQADGDRRRLTGVRVGCRSLDNPAARQGQATKTASNQAGKIQHPKGDVKRVRKMTLQKIVYLSVKRKSFATAVKVLTLIFGIGVVIAAVCVYAIFSGCGGGGLDNGGSPMYDENGVCVNCNGDGWVMSEDGYIQQGHDSVPTYADGKPIPQPDTTPYVCPVSDPPEMCMPKEALQGECGNMGDGPKCYFGFMAGKPCTSDAECKKVPLDAYPPVRVLGSAVPVGGEVGLYLPPYYNHHGSKW